MKCGASFIFVNALIDSFFTCQIFLIILFSRLYASTNEIMQINPNCDIYLPHHIYNIDLFKCITH